MENCEFEGCVRGAISKGLCTGHYQQRRLGKELTPLQNFSKGYKKSNPPCTFESCGREQKSKGYCDAHYRQLKRGAELTPIGSTAKAKPKGVCSVEGCDLVEAFTSLCRRHYTHKLEGKPLVPFEPKIKNSICSFEGCSNKCKVYNLCGAHYVQHLKGQNLKPLLVHKKEPMICAACGISFMPARKSSLYCSVPCSSSGKTHPIVSSYKNKDYSKVLRLVEENVAKEDGCWNWRGKLSPKGYSAIGSRGLHRVVLEAKLGQPLGTEQAHHICANRQCVNPDHLQPVSARENIAEMNQRNFYLRRIAELEDALRSIKPDHHVLRSVADNISETS